MKNFNLPAIKTGFSPRKVAQQSWSLRDLKAIDHKKALKGGSGIGFGKAKNPLAK